MRNTLAGFFLERQKRRTNKPGESQVKHDQFVSEVSLSHFTTQFMSFVVKDSTQLIKRNKKDAQDEESKEQDLNKNEILNNILRMIEVDRLLLNNLNAIIVNDMAGLNIDS